MNDIVELKSGFPDLLGQRSGEVDLLRRSLHHAKVTLKQRLKPFLKKKTQKRVLQGLL